MVKPIDDKPKLDMYDDKLLFWTDPSDGSEYCLHVQSDDSPMDPREECDRITVMFCNRRRHHIGDDVTGPDGRQIKDPAVFWAKLVRDHVPEDVVRSRIKAGTVPGYVPDTDDDEGLFEDFLSYVEQEDGVRAAMEMVKDYVAWLPLWLYEHSGITMSCGARTYPYNDQWDSSAIGWIAMSKDSAVGNLATNADGKHPELPDWEAAALDCMRGEVRTYDDYITGNVYGYTLYRKKPGGEGQGGDSEEDYEWVDGYCGGFFDSDVMSNGMVENVGHGMEEAVASGEYRTGTAEPHVVKTYRFRPDKE